MALYNFQKRFVPMIESGRKLHTIRAKRKHPAKPGDTLYLYTGLRQPGARKLKETVCTKVEDIRIHGDDENPTVTVDDQELTHDERERLAYCDGFESFAEMASFWNGRLPFHGDIIHWK